MQNNTMIKTSLSHKANLPGLARNRYLNSSIFSRDRGNGHISLGKEKESTLGVTFDEVRVLVDELFVVDWIDRVMKPRHCPRLIRHLRGRQVKMAQNRKEKEECKQE